MSDTDIALGRCPNYGRVFVIPPGKGVALCDRLLCQKNEIVPLGREEALPADLRPEPALLARLTYKGASFICRSSINELSSQASLLKYSCRFFLPRTA